MTHLKLAGTSEPGHSIGASSDELHFLGRCDECDAHYMARMNLGRLENAYQNGLVGQDAFEAYMHVWATSCHRYSSTSQGWQKPPTYSPRAMDIVEALKAAMSRKAEIERSVAPSA